MMKPAITLLTLLSVACAPAVTEGEVFGDTHSGSYHLGPVDWEQSQWTNSCGPYPAAIQTLEGRYLAGVDNAFNGAGQLCDACALVTTGRGKSLLVRIVTTGASNAPCDMDLSSAAYEALFEADPNGTPQNPRPMRWQLAHCAAGTSITLQFQPRANAFWTSLWVRNARLPIERVEVQSTKHPDFFALRRENDGTWNDDGGFGEGTFTLRITALGGKSATQTFLGFEPGAVVETTVQFD